MDSEPTTPARRLLWPDEAKAPEPPSDELRQQQAAFWAKGAPPIFGTRVADGSIPQPLPRAGHIGRDERMKRLLIGLCAAAAVGLSGAQAVTIESVAVTIAKQHNANAAAMLDDMTASTSAKAVGKNVIFTNVLRVKRGLPAGKLAEFKAATQAEILPRACKVNADNEGFKRGLYYTFVYENTYRERLAEFIVDAKACAALAANR